MHQTYYKTKKASNELGLWDSKFEASYAQELSFRLKAKDIKNWEAQKTLDLIVNDYLVCTYKIDFIIYHNDGTLEYVETKGFPTNVWRLKWKLFESLYTKPGVKLTVVFQGAGSVPRPRKIKKI